MENGIWKIGFKHVAIDVKFYIVIFLLSKFNKLIRFLNISQNVLSYFPSDLIIKKVFASNLQFISLLILTN